MAESRTSITQFLVEKSICHRRPGDVVAVTLPSLSTSDLAAFAIFTRLE